VYPGLLANMAASKSWPDLLRDMQIWRALESGRYVNLHRVNNWEKGRSVPVGIFLFVVLREELVTPTAS